MPKTKVNNNIKLKSGGGLINDATDGLSVDNTNISPSKNSITMVAGQDLATGDAVFVSGAIILSEGQSSSVSNNKGVYGSNYIAQTFLSTGSKVVSVDIRGSANNQSGQILNVAVRETSDGFPIGANIEGKVASVAMINNFPIQLNNKLTFADPVNIELGKTYALVFYSSSQYSMISYSGSDEYSRGKMYHSTDSGLTWTATDVNRDIAFSCNMSFDAGYIFKTSALLNNQSATNFIGFSSGNYLKGANANIIVGGKVNCLSLLTAGVPYYLSDTPGAISSSAGTNSKKIGVSLSATELLIKQDN